MVDHKQKKTLGPPPRWMDCPKKSTIIVDKFIAFKTPLDSSYDSQVPSECSFNPSMIIGSLSDKKARIGLWIDLTNTTGYYEKSEVERHNIYYVKLECRGNGECPDIDQTSRFIGICQQFISQHPLEVIGVHCTHGFNRTGFLIVAFLIESLSWGVEAAVNAFSQARPPGIYKAEYLRELFKRYGDIKNTPPAPPLPEWCNDTIVLPYEPASQWNRRNYRLRRGKFHFERPCNSTHYHLVNGNEQYSLGGYERQHPYRGDRYRWNSNRRLDAPQIPYPRASYLFQHSSRMAPEGTGLARPFSASCNVSADGADLGVARGAEVTLQCEDKPIYRIGHHEQSAQYSNHDATVPSGHFAERGSLSTGQQPRSRHRDNSEVPPSQIGIARSRNPFATGGFAKHIPNYFARTPQ